MIALMVREKFPNFFAYVTLKCYSRGPIQKIYIIFLEFFLGVRENDIFMLSTMLDPCFGKRAILLNERKVWLNLKNRIIKISSHPFAEP